MYPTDVPGSAAPLAPGWLRWLQAGRIGWPLSLLPLGLLAWFASLIETVAGGSIPTLTVPWVPGLGVTFAFAIDGLGLLFALIITGMGTLIFIYAGGYMAGHPQIGRLYLYLCIFMVAMLGVVLADNLITLFIFWELTSISSYLLIGFNHAAASSRTAALQSLLVTGAGGLAMLAGFVLLGIAGGSLELYDLQAAHATILASPLYLPALTLVLIGAFTKSAQFPFQFWLPGAMAAPTPVSAYLHSATMVKAGVYLVARLTPVLGGTPAWHLTITTIGAITLLLGAYVALMQTDLKRVLAFTTVSALGILMLLLGIGSEAAITAAMVFLIVHALYKGALFMIAGAIDHETGTRNLRELGGLRAAMPWTAAAAILAALSMTGIPPFLGFVGKELIYEGTSEMEHLALTPLLLTGVAFLGNVLTITAACLVVAIPFFGATKPTPHKPHEAPLSMLFGPLLLGALGLLIGTLPDLLATPIVNAATTAILVEDPHIHLALWHGFNAVLVLSGVTIATGVAIYTSGAWQHGAPPILKAILADSPDQGYHGLLGAMQTVARWQTRVLQSGYLRYYLTTILITAGLLIGYTAFSSIEWSELEPFSRVFYTYEAVIAVIILAAAWFVIRANRLLQAVAGLGVVGFGVAIIFLLGSAPDLAITQFAIETLSVILFVLVLYRMPELSRRATPMTHLRDAAMALGAGVVMTLLVLATISGNIERHLTPYFAENSYVLAHGRNVVNVILVDFRALDTMGEITVIAIAALGIYSLLKLQPQQPNPPADPAAKKKEPGS